MPAHTTTDSIVESGTFNRIQRVTVFNDQARVRRVVSASCVKGMNQFAVEVTAFQVVADTVQGEVLAKGRIVGVQYKEVPIAQFRQPELDALEEEKKRLERARAFTSQKRENALKQRKFLDSVASFSQVQVPQEIQTAMVSMDKLRELGTFLQQGYEENCHVVQALDDEIVGLDTDIQVVDRKLKAQGRLVGKSLKVVEVVFDSDEVQQAEIHLDYNVSGAGWQPVYRLDVSDREKSVTLQQFAQVTQKTGEDWGQVLLTLSNASSVQTAQVPNLNSWWLDVYRAPPGVAKRVRQRSHPNDIEETLMASFEEEVVPPDAMLAAGEVSEPAAPAPYVEVAISDQGISFEYDLSQPVDIASAGDTASVPIQQSTLPGDFYHLVVPKAETVVYYVCSVQAEASLLPGAVNVFHEGRYVTSTHWQEKSAGEPLVFNLGVDRGVQVTRETLRDTAAETFFGMVDRSSVAREIEVLIRLENNREDEITLKCVDHVPVARTDVIQIKGVTVNPEPEETEYQHKPGVMLWSFSLPAGETREIKEKYFVKYPKNEVPHGL